MKALHRVVTGLILLWLGGGLVNTAQAAQLCKTATPQTLIAWYNKTHSQQPLRYDPVNSAIYHPIAVFRTARPHLTWIGLAWLSPTWGAVFATDCNGKPLAAVSDGAVGKLSAGPELPGIGQTVVAEYVDRETANCVHDSISILALRNGKLTRLWQHESRQGMNLNGRQPAFHGFVTRNYTLQYSDDGRTLQVTGDRAAYPYLENGSQSGTASAAEQLPKEIYQWNAKRERFVPQDKYRQFGICVNAWPSPK